jgi:CTP:molybdopterin cytidylyltransferase MocA
MSRREGALWGIVPAAGRSSRMGSPKALLDAGGPTFIDRVVKGLLDGGCAEVVAVVREDPGPVAAAARRSGARVQVNPAPDDPVRGGQVSSVRTGLAAVPDDAAGVVVLPVDHPLVASGTVAALIEAFRGGEAPAVVPTLAERRGHPVVLGAALFAELGEEGLDEGVRTVLARHGEAVARVPVRDRGIVKDIDTLADYRRAFPRAYRRRFHAR